MKSAKTKKNFKKTISCLMAVFFFFSILPIEIKAEENSHKAVAGDFIVEGDPTGYTYTDGVLTFTIPGDYKVSMFPVITVGDFTVKGAPDGYAYDEGEHVLTFTKPGNYIVAMAGGKTETTDRIVVTGGTESDPVKIRLKDVAIDVSANEEACAFELTGSAVLNLTLEGSNKLWSGAGCSGLQVTAGTVLIIDGTGALDAKSNAVEPSDKDKDTDT